jgi:hypothetical protein
VIVGVRDIVFEKEAEGVREEEGDFDIEDEGLELEELVELGLSEGLISSS